MHVDKSWLEAAFLPETEPSRSVRLKSGRLQSYRACSHFGVKLLEWGTDFNFQSLIALITVSLHVAMKAWTKQLLFRYLLWLFLIFFANPMHGTWDCNGKCGFFLSNELLVEELVPENLLYSLVLSVFLPCLVLREEKDFPIKFFIIWVIWVWGLVLRILWWDKSMAACSKSHSSLFRADFAPGGMQRVDTRRRTDSELFTGVTEVLSILR